MPVNASGTSNFQIKVTADTNDAEKNLKRVSQETKNLENAVKDVKTNASRSFDDFGKSIERLAGTFGATGTKLGKSLSEGISKAFENVSADTGNLENTTAALEKLSGVAKTAAGVIAVAAAGIGASVAAFSKADEILATTGRIEGLTAAFQNLQSSIGADSIGAIESLRSSTRGLVSDLDLFQSANQAVLLGVDDGSGKFQEMAAAALKLGQSMGITAKDALDSLVIGIGRQSKLVLDNLGIIVQAESAYESYAASIGKSANALSDQEKKLAFNAAAYNAIIQKSSQLATVQETAATAATRLKVTLENQNATYATTISRTAQLAAAYQSLNAAAANNNTQALAQSFARLAAVGGELKALFDNLGVAIGRVYSVYFAPFVNTMLSGLASLIHSVNAFAAEWLGAGETSAKTTQTISQNLNTLYYAFTALGQAINDVWSDIWASAALTFGAIVDFGANAAKKLIAIFQTVASAITQVLNGIISGYNSVSSSLGGIGGQLEQLDASKVGDNLVAGIDKFAAKAKSSIVDVADSIASLNVGGIATAAPAALFRAAEEANSSLAKTTNTVGGLKQSLQGLGDTGTGAGDKLSSSAKKAAREYENLNDAIQKSNLAILKSAGVKTPTGNKLSGLFQNAEASKLSAKQLADALKVERDAMLASASTIKEKNAALQRFSSLMSEAKSDATQFGNELKQIESFGDSLRDSLGQPIKLNIKNTTLKDIFGDFQKGASPDLIVKKLLDGKKLGKFTADEFGKFTDAVQRSTQLAQNDITQTFDNFTKGISSSLQSLGLKGSVANKLAPGIQAAFSNIGNVLDGYASGQVAGKDVGSDLLKGIGDGILSQTSGGDAATAGIGAAIGTIGRLIKAKALKDSQERGKETGAAIGTGLGAGIGAIFGGAEGAAIGAQIGGGIGKWLGSIFSKASPGEKERKQFAKTFSDFFKSLGKDIGGFKTFNLDAFIQSDNKFFKQFVDASGRTTTLVQQQLDSLKLSDATLSSFDGVGKAVAASLGIAGDKLEQYGSQFGQLLALSLGGGGQGIKDANGVDISNQILGVTDANNMLNELQLLLQGAKISAEDAGKALEDAFFKGTLGAGDFLNASSAIEQTLQAGIPGAVGATAQAFQNLVSGGTASGQRAQDALRDLAIEAQEKGVSSIQGLQSELIASGKTADEVGKLMAALAQNSITSLSQLSQIDIKQTAGITASLQNIGFAFTDNAKQIEEATKNVDAFIQKANQKVVTEWEIKTTVSGDTIPAQVQSGTGFSGQQVQ